MKSKLFVLSVIVILFSTIAYCQDAQVNADSFYNEGYSAYVNKDYKKAYACLLRYKYAKQQKFDAASTGSFYRKVDETINYCYSQIQSNFKEEKHNHDVSTRSMH